MIINISFVFLMLFLQHKCILGQSATTHDHRSDSITTAITYNYNSDFPTKPTYRTTTTANDNSDFPTKTPYPATGTPGNCLKNKYVNQDQIPYTQRYYNFFCSYTPYMRIRTQLAGSGTFQLRVTVKAFTSTSTYYDPRIGFWIANSYEAWNWPENGDPSSYYAINCQYKSACSFTADPNTDVDILIYVGYGSTNSYSFVIEDISPPSRLKVWVVIVCLVLLFLVAAVFLVLIGRYMRMRRIAKSHPSARMDRVPEGLVVNIVSTDRWHQAQNQQYYSTPTMPTFETENEKTPVPDGPRVNIHVI